MLFCETNVDGTIGGSYYSLLYLVKGLDKIQFAPLVLFHTEHILLDAFKSAGAEIVVWPKAGGFSFSARLPRVLGFLQAPLAVVQKAMNLVQGFFLSAVARAVFIRRRSVDLVHLNNSILYNHDWMLAARLAGRPCVSHERGINEGYPAWARFWGRRLDAIICISEAVRGTMAAAGADFGNLHTIHNGFDPAEVRLQVPAANLRRDLGIGADDDVIVMVGNLKEWKGQTTLVKALDIVRKVRPTVRCLLVGATAPADAAFERELRALVAALDLNQRVIFAGFRKNVADFIALSDVVVHASTLPEPFGRVVLEAMACRRPVVGSRAGGVLEIVDDGATGLTFPPGDEVALAAAVGRLLADRTAARAMGDAGHRRLVDRFHIDRNVQATEQLYETLLARTP